MILSFNTIWVVVVFIFSLGILHAKVTDGVEDNANSISQLKSKVESDSKSIYMELKLLSKAQNELNKRGTEHKNDIEWIKKGQEEIKDLIKGRQYVKP